MESSLEGLSMNYHGDKKERQGNHNHSPLKHVLHMALCCGLPILIIGFLPLIAKSSPEAGRMLGKIAPFLCPIMMIAMLPMMFGSKKKRSCCDNTDESQDNNNPLELSKPTE